MFYLICAWTNGWTNTRDAGYLRRSRANYDVTDHLGDYYISTCMYISVYTVPTWLTHGGRVTHKCVGTVNVLSPGRRQAIIWTNVGILLIGPLGTILSRNFNRNSNFCMEENTFENVVCEILSISSPPHCVNPIKYAHDFLVFVCGGYIR